MEAGKLMIRYKGMLPPLEELGKNAAAAKNLNITHINDSSLYIYFEEDKLLIIPETDAFLKIDHKPADFHTPTFYR